MRKDVQRTFIVTTGKATTINSETKEINTIDYEVAGDYTTDADKLVKAIKKTLPSDIILVKVDSVALKGLMRAMSVEDFIAQSRFVKEVAITDAEKEAEAE